MRSIDEFANGQPPLEWGPFRIDEVLGSGQYGRVFKAIWRTELSPDIGKQVAVKVLERFGSAEAPRARRAFLREVQVARTIVHPGIVEAFEGNEEQGRLWLAMEYLPGGTLADRMAAGPIEAGEVIRFGLELAAALEAIHEHEGPLKDGSRGPLGLVHRDVKPANVLLDARGRAKLGDFGIVKATAEATSASTLGARGSPAWAAPEQICDEPVDRRTDLWALGAVLFEMATGTRAFGGRRIEAVIHAVLSIEERWQQLQEEAEAAVPGLGPVIAGCLRRRPEDRYATAGALAADLLEIDARSHLDFESDELPRPWAGFRLLERIDVGSAYGLWRAEVSGRPASVAVFRESVDPAVLRRVKELAAHPGLVPIVDLGETQGLTWAVWEEAGAESLGRRLEKPIESGGVIRWVRRVAGGLAGLHDAGIAHGSVGAGSVVLDPDGRARLHWAGLGATVGPGEASQRADVAALGRLIEVLVTAGERDAEGEPDDNTLAGLATVARRCGLEAARQLDAGGVVAAISELIERGRLDFESKVYPRTWGDFELLRKLGAGAFGTVWEADWRAGLGEPKRVALKVLRPARSEAAPDRLALFRREAGVALSVKHPNLVDSYRADESYGLLWLAMERIDGPSLRERLGEEGSLAPAEVLRIGRGICRGLQALHHARRPTDDAPLGSVHRDLKPSNVMLAGDRVVVMDFGITRTSASGTEVTDAGSGMTRGTIHFMSPEQWRAEDLDPRSDLYALGVLLLEAATGRLLFGGAREPRPLFECVMAVEGQLAGIRASVDRALPGLGDVIAGCLRLAREDRWSSAAEVEELLAGLEAAVPEDVRPREPKRPSPDPPPPKPDPNIKTTRRMKVERRRWGTTATVLSVLVLVVGLVVAVLVGRTLLDERQTLLPAAAEIEVDEAEEATSPAAPPVDPLKQRAAELSPMIEIPEGPFWMGCPESGWNCEKDEGPGQTVQMSTYWIDEHEVTVAAYRLCVEAGACTQYHQPGSFFRSSDPWQRGCEDCPAVWLDWQQASTFCGWLDRALPTEAQWEKAARGADGRIWSTGEQPPATVANAYPKPVGTHPESASPYGVQDVAGSVWEWTSDWYSPDYYGTDLGSDPTGPKQGEKRTMRGGADGTGIVGLRVFRRLASRPDSGYFDDGFRCARDAPPGDVLALGVEGTLEEEAVWTPGEDAAELGVDLLSSDPLRLRAAELAPMVEIPEGPFWMGCPESGDWPCEEHTKPGRQVQMSTYWIDKHEVTAAAYRLCVEAGGCSEPRRAFSGWHTRSTYWSSECDDCPVNYITWGNADSFCRWLGRTLPTEARWEKAARGTDGRVWPGGNRRPSNPQGPHGGIHRAGRLGESPFGAWDMAGNLEEWTADRYSANRYAVAVGADPAGPSAGSFRVVRGGSYISGSDGLRTYRRTWEREDEVYPTRGFRCSSRGSMAADRSD